MADGLDASRREGDVVVGLDVFEVLRENSEEIEVRGELAAND
jgi:hypothetical protein